MSAHILLVEDNNDDLELAVLAFQEAKITNPVVVARDGVEAIDYLFATGKHAGRTPAELPIVVLLDLKLPRLSGLEVLQRIRGDERTRRLPVAVLTSSKDEHDLASCYDNGANSYVRKPVDFDKFVEVARQLGLYWTVVNEPAPPKREQ